MELFSYFGMAATLIAVWLMAQPRLAGMALAAVANTSWVVYSIYTGEWAMLGQAGILLCINIRGYFNWKRVGIK